MGAAFMLGVGESGGGILATFAFLTTDAPEYRLGYSLCLGFLSAGVVAPIMYYAACRWQNRALRLDEERETERERESVEVGLSPERGIEEREVEFLRDRRRKRELEWGYRYFL